MKTSADFLTSARSIPTWVTGLAFISANLGALELVGMAASGAKYGIATRALLLGRRDSGDGLSRRVHDCRFITAPRRARCRNICKCGFNKPVMGLNAIGFAVMTVFASRISMNALAKLLNQLLGGNYHFALFVCSGVVLVYVLKAIDLGHPTPRCCKFFMIVLGFAAGGLSRFERRWRLERHDRQAPRRRAKSDGAGFEHQIVRAGRLGPALKPLLGG